MKSIFLRFVFGMLAACFAASTAVAGGIAVSGVSITHQTGNAEMFIVRFVVNNNSGETLSGARVYADRVYCDKNKATKEAASADTPSIAIGATHKSTLTFQPGDEPYLRISVRQAKNSEPYAEVTIPRAKYDPKGAALYKCQTVKKPGAPATVVPADNMKKMAPKP